MPILQGRALDQSSTSSHEALVSESLARRLAPGRSPLGLRFRNAVASMRGTPEPWQTVIGVVPDVVSNLVARDGGAALFRPFAPTDLDQTQYSTLVVRTRSADAATQLRSLAAIAGQASTPEIVSIHDTIDETMSEPRFVMRILTAFALLGVVLAAIGLFGVISFSVRQRTREIGVRMSVGATRTAIASLVVRDGLRLSLLGIVAGLVGAAAASRLIHNQLYDVASLDPFAFVVGAGALVVISVVACIAPMLHATRIDPAVAVRSE